ncbi:hypothetical protein G7046_g2200 [Stylonectria norvegica]|nr:hypothetical protein G7046_g2200 [Stylonectria norvegica]
MTQPPLHFNIDGLAVAPNSLQDTRNFCTIQGAIYRGDKNIVLHNTNEIRDDWWPRLRYRHIGNDGHENIRIVHYRELQSRKKVTNESAIEATGPLEVTNWLGFKLEFVKILAAGGFGAATLWKAKAEGGVETKVVIKVGLQQNFDAPGESWWHERYDRSIHIVQLFDLNSWAKDKVQRFELENPMAISQYHLGREFVPKDLNIVVLEFMQFGDFSDFLKRAAQLKTQFSAKVLWEIFECFVYGIAAVAYQPVFDENHGRSFERDIRAAERLGVMDKFWENLAKCPLAHDVHFDMEPQNVLIGTDAHHPHKPVFKLHDFGVFSHQMNTNWVNWREANYWYERKPPKAVAVTPEQVTREWDGLVTGTEFGNHQFSGSNLELPGKTEIAGRYGAWTNVFLMGKMMEALITSTWLVHPFSAFQLAPIEGAPWDAKSHGHRLQDEQYYSMDEELMDLICRFHARKQLGFEDEETEEETRRFWKAFFSPAPAVPQAAAPPPPLNPQAPAFHYPPPPPPPPKSSSKRRGDSGLAGPQGHRDKRNRGISPAAPLVAVGTVGQPPRNPGAGRRRITPVTPLVPVGTPGYQPPRNPGAGQFGAGHNSGNRPQAAPPKKTAASSNPPQSLSAMDLDSSRPAASAPQAQGDEEEDEDEESSKPDRNTSSLNRGAMRLTFAVPDVSSDEEESNSGDEEDMTDDSDTPSTQSEVTDDENLGDEQHPHYVNERPGKQRRRKAPHSYALISPAPPTPVPSKPAQKTKSSGSSISKTLATRGATRVSKRLLAKQKAAFDLRKSQLVPRRAQANVERNLDEMPVAIQNLFNRVRELDERLERGDFDPVMDKKRG